MPPEAISDRQISFLQFMLFSGGLPLVAFGMVFSVWGIINVIRARNPGLIFAQAVLSFLPSIFAMIGIYTSCLGFMEMGASTIPPKPAEFAAVTGASMSYGFLGIASTFVPVMLGLIAFHRYCQRSCKVSTIQETGH